MSTLRSTVDAVDLVRTKLISEINKKGGTLVVDATLNDCIRQLMVLSVDVKSDVEAGIVVKAADKSLKIQPLKFDGINPILDGDFIDFTAYTVKPCPPEITVSTPSIRIESVQDVFEINKQIIATVTKKKKISFIAKSSLPDGVTLNETSGIISGMPHVPFSEHVVVDIVADKAVTQTCLLEFAIAARPVISCNNTLLVSGNQNSELSVSINALVTENKVLLYSTKNKLPDGLTLNSSTGVITGTPSVEYKGDIIVDITAEYAITKHCIVTFDIGKEITDEVIKNDINFTINNEILSKLAVVMDTIPSSNDTSLGVNSTKQELDDELKRTSGLTNEQTKSIPLLSEKEKVQKINQQFIDSRTAEYINAGCEIVMQ